jgi:hypothetical protein
VDVRWWQILLTGTSVGAFIASCFLQLYVKLGLWQIAIGIAQISALAGTFALIFLNTKRAKQIIKAHLMLIRNDGIAPASTPVYQKFLMYQAILYVIGVPFIAFLVLNIFLSAMDAPAWVVWFVNNIVQFLIIAMILWLYRPRGKTLDRFMQPDVPGEGVARKEILLEDLEEFAMDADQGAMREWEDGMELPLQPIVVSSRERKERADEMYGVMIETPTIGDFE